MPGIVAVIWRMACQIAGFRWMPSVLAELDGREVEFRARLVVGADGRDAPFRRWAGFDVKRDPGHTLVAGLLLDNVSVAEDASHAWLNPDLGMWVLIFPQGDGVNRCSY